MLRSCWYQRSLSSMVWADQPLNPESRGLGFRVQGFGDLGFRVSGLGFNPELAVLEVDGVMFRV